MEEVRVLVIGAGGIGCEVLKNLVLSGFRKLTVVDLDSIDVSNLNRQFLFRQKDVGLSKAYVASKAVRRYLNSEESAKLDINIHVDRVQNLPMDVFSGQDIVMNALDNFEARRYVNRVCVGLDLPLIESGSTGNNGQVFPIWSKAGTECFECRDQPVPETYPVCTVRLTPEKPEHCVAWARYLLEVLFGPPDANNVLSDLADALTEHTTDSDNPQNFAASVAQSLFDSTISALIKAKAFVPTDNMPKPLPIADMLSRLDLQKMGSGESIVKATQKEAQDILSMDRNLAMFLDCAAALKQRAEEVKFDKDDDLAMGFVAAATSLRSANYGINQITLWTAKSIAGAIQPAIAATNAMVAGLQVEQAKKILKLKSSNTVENLTKSLVDSAGVRFIWVRETPAAGYSLLAEKLDDPKPTCFVCQQKRVRVTLRSLQEWDMRHFIQKVLRDALGCEGDVTLQTAEDIVYDPDILEDDPGLEERLLADTGIENGTLLSVTAMAATAMSFDLVVIEDPSEKQFADKTAEDYHCVVTKANEVESGTVMNAEYYRDKERKEKPLEAVDLDGEAESDDEKETLGVKRARSPTSTGTSPQYKKSKRRGEDE